MAPFKNRAATVVQMHAARDIGILDRAVWAADPWIRLDGGWFLRRLAPDCSRIEIESLSKTRDERKLLYAMGLETANIHLGNKPLVAAIQKDLAQRPAGWLKAAAERMLATIDEDWKAWRR